MSDPLDLQLKHFIDDLHVFITLRDLSPRWTRCCPGVTKVVVCHTRFLYQNQVLIVCMTHDQLVYTYGQKRSRITKCHE
jgi:hypothetical protein